MPTINRKLFSEMCVGEKKYISASRGFDLRASECHRGRQRPHKIEERYLLCWN